MPPDHEEPIWLKQTQAVLAQERGSIVAAASSDAQRLTECVAPVADAGVAPLAGAN